MATQVGGVGDADRGWGAVLETVNGDVWLVAACRRVKVERKVGRCINGAPRLTVSAFRRHCCTKSNRYSQAGSWQIDDFQLAPNSRDPPNVYLLAIA